MNKLTISWILAIAITLGAAIYQRLTGPTHPKRVTVHLDKDYNLKLIRSQGGTVDAEVVLAIDNQDVTAKLFWRNFPPVSETWNEVNFARKNDDSDLVLAASLPNQPPAGKLQYYIELTYNQQVTPIVKDEPVVIRYKGAVPMWILIPHIFFMFFAMLISNLTGLLVVFKHDKFKFYGNLTLFLLLMGGMILGPLVQLYAFNELWTGIPFGWDLTDNKTLIAFTVWVVAFIANRKEKRPILMLAASVVLFMIYMIPHSMYGSELNRETGVISQGFINLVNFF